MDMNITPRPAAIAAAMDRAGEQYDSARHHETGRREGDRRAQEPDSDLLEIVRTLAQLQAQRASMTEQQLLVAAGPLDAESPVQAQMRAALAKRGYNPDGTASSSAWIQKSGS